VRRLEADILGLADLTDVNSGSLRASFVGERGTEPFFTIPGAQ
jgi:hypothetical protein